jgi:aspartate aminotransferase-like enzyme
MHEMGQLSYKNLLLTAGPAPLSPAVQQILSQPMIHHRGAEFVQIFKHLTESLKYLFQTKHDIIILTASGTGGMEATITNLFSPGETVVVVENGNFGERWSQIAEAFGLEVKRLKLPWGKSVVVGELKQFIHDTPLLKAVFLTHCETSTGALTDLAAIIPQVRPVTDALIIVDAVSSAGVLPLRMDQWGIDVVVTASQKGLGLAPGLSIIALNKRVWRKIEQAELPRYYFDFTRARQALRLERGSVYTPAIPLIIAADFVLDQMQQVGLENIWQKRAVLAAQFRARIVANGLSIFPEQPANALTVIKIDSVDRANQVITSLRDNYQIVVSSGQAQLFNKVIRVGHFVNVEIEHLERFLKGLMDILGREIK